MKVKLGDICSILNGFAFKSDKYVDEGIRVIRITNVQKGYIEDEKPQFYPIGEIDSIKDYILRENDILLSLTGNVGRVAMLDVDFLPAALNQRVACLRIKGSNIILRYLYYALLSNRFENDCISSAKGIAQKNMSTEWLKQYEINIYSKEKQLEIIDVLDNLSKIISARKQQVQQLDELVKARFVELFGDIHKPSKWEKRPWSELVTIQNGRDYKNIRVESGGYPVYGTGGEMARASEYLCPENTIIVGRKGTINNPLLVKEKFWNVDTAFGVIVGNQLHYQYFYNFCRMFDFSSLNKQAVLPSTTKADLLKIKIAVPPMEMQNQFADFVKEIDKSKFVVRNVVEKFGFCSMLL